MLLDIYGVIWYIVHLIFDVVDICCRFGTIAKAKCKSIQRRLAGEDFSSEKLLIEENKRILTKIPVHLAVILGTETPDFRALSKIIFWCLSAGIKNISFYDHQGNLRLIWYFKLSSVSLCFWLHFNPTNFMWNFFWISGILVSNNHKIYDHLSRWRNDNDKISWNTNNHDICGSQVIYKNGMFKYLTVNFLSPRECKLKIAELCRSMASDDNLQPDRIDINQLNAKFASIVNPDPDAAIYFGKVCSTYGFLPWHIRLTEFFPIESQRTMTVYSFLGTLFKFAKCEQRFGYWSATWI